MPTPSESLLEGSHQSSAVVHYGVPSALQQQQQQAVVLCQDDYNNNNNKNSSDYSSSSVEEEGLSSWRCTDFGQLGERSRDGSLHATDEVFNAASHLSATMVSILGTVLLISDSSARGEPWKIVSFSVYGASLIFLFGCSTIHHSIVGNARVEAFWRKMDYLAIYPLIAGTFTPLCLVFYHDSFIGWAFCSVVWGIAVAGMIGTALYFQHIPKWLSMTVYISLGWMGACMAYWLIPVLGWSGLSLFVLGGLFYTGGGYMYTMEVPNPFPGKFGFHELWHLAVIAGAFCHWCLAYFYVLPWEGPSSSPSSR